MTQVVNINKVQTITSLEIAELTGKQHKDLMKAIRNMEPAWEKVHGRKFALMFREVKIGNGAVRRDLCYQLTKTECLYRHEVQRRGTCQTIVILIARALLACYQRDARIYP